MTERGRAKVRIVGDTLAIGPSAMQWNGRSLTIAIDEIATPFPQRVRGEIRLTPHALHDQTFLLNPNGNHRWRPIAPRAVIEVRLEKPALSWSGNGYFDHNQGDEPIADGFESWNWQRTANHQDVLIHYDGLRRDGSSFALGVRFDDSNQATNVPLPQSYPLPASLWRVRRDFRSEDKAKIHLIETLEDTPFYTRSLARTQIAGMERIAVHESLSCQRLRSGLVQILLPFRMPRW